MDALDAISRLGGVAHLSTLRTRGVDPRELRSLVPAGVLIRPRQGWYALPAAPPHVIRAVSLGGQVTCISALSAWGIWCVNDRRLHVSVGGNASRLRSSPSVVVHYSAQPGATHSQTYDDIVHALAHTFTCQSRENVIVGLNSALNQQWIGSDALASVRSLVPAKYRPYFAAVDASCESGLETKCVLRLRALNIRFRTQVHIPGAGRVDVLVGERLVIELDGIAYHSGAAVREDRRRDLALHRMGYLVVRVGYGQVMDEWDAVENVIRGYVARGEHRWSARHLRAGFGAGAM